MMKVHLRQYALPFLFTLMGLFAFEEKVRAQTSSEVLYLEQENFEPLGLSLSLSKGSSGGLNYYRTESDQGSLMYFSSPWFGFGGLYKKFQIHQSTLANRLEAEYKLQGLQIDQRLPSTSAYLLVKFRPLLGRWNLLSKSTVDCALGVGFGVGQRSFQIGNRSTSFFSSLGFEIFFRRFQVGLEQQLELDGFSGGSANWSESVVTAGVHF